MNVTAEPIQLRNDNRALALAGRAERCGELRAALQGVSPLAGLDFNVLANNLIALGGGKACDVLTLGFKSEARAPLSGSGDPKVGNNSGGGHGRLLRCLYRNSTNILVLYKLNLRR